MSSETLNVAGLTLNIVGVVILFIFGFPQPTFEEDVGLSVDAGTVFADGTRASDLAAAARQRKRTYRTAASIALVLILAGYAAQVLALVHHPTGR